MNQGISNHFNDAKVLVVGGSGFIGRNLVESFKGFAGHVYSIQTKNSEFTFNDPNVSNVKHDLSSESETKRIIKEISPDYVFNVSGYINHSPFFKEGFGVIKNHYLSTLNLINAMRDINIKRYIHTGSSDEYGNLISPQSERLRENPMTPYSASKVAISHTLEAISHSDNFPATILKLFIVYGPHQGKGRLIPDVIQALLAGDEIQVSSGEQKRDFCYIEDIIDAFKASAVTEKAIGQSINIGTGSSIPVVEVVKKIESKLDTGRVIYGGKKIRDHENLDLYPDITLAKKILEWQPSTDIDKGIDQTIQFYRDKFKVGEGK